MPTVPAPTLNDETLCRLARDIELHQHSWDDILAMLTHVLSQPSIDIDKVRANLYVDDKTFISALTSLNSSDLKSPQPCPRDPAYLTEILGPLPENPPLKTLANLTYVFLETAASIHADVKQLLRDGWEVDELHRITGIPTTTLVKIAARTKKG